MSDLDLNALFEQAKALQQKMSSAQADLAKKTVTGQSGGGMVTATVNGALELVSIKLDPLCVDARDIKMLEDLIVAATNQANREARKMAERELGAATGLSGMLGGLPP